MDVVLYFHPAGSKSFSSVMDGVKEIASKAGWHLQELNIAPTRKNLRELRQFWNPVGAIVDAGGSTLSFSAQDLKPLPIVFLDRAPRTLPSNALVVCHDSRATASLAARELLATGFEHFAYIPFPEPRFWSDEREDAFCKAIRLNGKSCAVFRPGKVASADSVAYLTQLQDFLAALPKPCGVFAANDRTAEDVLVTAQRLKLDVPNDLSVIGVDNYAPICRNTIPTLSSVEPDFRRGGSLAALLLMEALGTAGRFTGARLRSFGPHCVVRRASTCVLRAPDADVAAALDLIERESCAGLTAAQVVGTFSCSRVSAEIRFRKATGKSILEAIHAVRLERAKELLRNPHQQLKSIADFCGFRNPNSLCKFFLKETGQTMSAYRLHMSGTEEKPSGRS